MSHNQLNIEHSDEYEEEEEEEEKESNEDSILQEEVDRLMDIGYVYPVPENTREALRRNAEAQIDRANEVIDSITDRPAPNEHWQFARDNHNRIVKQNNRHFYFDFTDRIVRRELYQHLHQIVTRFMNQLPVSAKWLIQYRMANKWKTIPVDRWTLPRILDQIEEQALDIEIDDAVPDDDARLRIHSDAPFACHIQQIAEIHFVDITAYRELADGNQQPRVIPAPEEQPNLVDDENVIDAMEEDDDEI